MYAHASLIDTFDLTTFHDVCLAQPGWAKQSPEHFAAGVWHWIERNHRYNCLLWDEEDQARRTDVSDSEIAVNKRAIDKYNQARNDATEKVDEILLTRLADIAPRPDCRLNSETAGSMIDRLSILALKIHHMTLQTRRADVEQGHIRRCADKLERLIMQRHDLATCLENLLDECQQGTAKFTIYRQFKMYNDPTLNPCLYGAARAHA